MRLLAGLAGYLAGIGQVALEGVLQLLAEVALLRAASRPDIPALAVELAQQSAQLLRRQRLPIPVGPGRFLEPAQALQQVMRRNLLGLAQGGYDRLHVAQQ